MADRFQIRDLSFEEAGIAANFFRENWNENHIFFRNRELLLWQYYDNPYAKKFSQGLTFKAAFDGTKVIGVFGYIPFVFNKFGERLYGCHLSAWWVHPDYRRGTMGMKLLYELQFNMSFDACISGINTSIAEQLYERLRWVVVYNIPRLILPINKTVFFALVDKENQESAIKALNSLQDSNLTSINLRDSGVEISEISSFNELYGLNWDTFYWQDIAVGHMGPARETAYLAWRYGLIPVFQYRGLLAKKDGKIIGLCIFRVEKIKDRNEKIIRLVDIIATDAAVPFLIHALIEKAKQNEAVMVDYFCTNLLYHNDLTKAGFIDCRSETGERYWFPHLFQPLDYSRTRLNCAWWVKGMDLRSEASKNSFLLMKGDYEFDRPN